MTVDQEETFIFPLRTEHHQTLHLKLGSRKKIDRSIGPVNQYFRHLSMAIKRKSGNTYEAISFMVAGTVQPIGG